MFTRLVRYFYPDIQDHELRKFILLALTFFLIIGTYWLLRLLKDTIFLKVAFPEGLRMASPSGTAFSANS